MRSEKPAKKPAVRQAVGKKDHSTVATVPQIFTGREIINFRKNLLRWYDSHRRSLPWRSAQGQANPYHVWLSEIMLQQTVVAAVIPYFIKFVEKWPCVTDLAAAPQEEIMKEWAGLGYYARARNLHKCAQMVSTVYHGQFPATQEELRALPGIGDYTSAAIAAIAFDRPATVIDGNVDRVIARYAAITEPFPAGKKYVRAYAERLSAGRQDRPGDFAQAMMDLGATICIPKAARCGLCPVAGQCRGRVAGIQDGLPCKKPAAEKPQKHGYVYWLRNKRGDIMMVRRPETAMMGGMMALPVSTWVPQDEKPAHDPAILDVCSNIKTCKSVMVKHSFTHFDLVLYGVTGEMADAKLDGKAVGPSDMEVLWLPEKRVVKAGVPSLFAKAIRLFLKR